MAELKRTISSYEFSQWRAFFAVEPFGDPWAHTAVLASLLAEAHRDRKRRPQPYTAADFYPGKRPAPDPWLRWQQAKLFFGKMNKVDA